MGEIRWEVHLRHPVDEEEFYYVTEAGIDRANRLIFHTKNGKEVCFVKEKQDAKEMNQ